MKTFESRCLAFGSFLLIGLTCFVSGLDLGDVQEGSCRAIRDVPHVSNFNPTLLDQMTFIAGGNKYQLYRHARGHPHFSMIREYKFFYEACLYKNVSVAEGSGSTFGFGDQRLVTYDTRRRNNSDPAGVSVVTQERPGPGIQSGQRFTTKVTMSDGRNYAVMVHCWEELNQKGWSLYSRQYVLNRELRQKVQEHVLGMGFDRDNIAFLEYQTCRYDEDYDDVVVGVGNPFAGSGGRVKRNALSDKDYNDKKKTSHEEDKKKSSHDDDKKKTSHDDDKKKTSHEEDKKKSSHDDDKKKTSHEEDKKTTSHDEKKKSSHDDDKKKTSHDDKKKTSHDDKKMTSHDDKNKTTHDDKKKSSHDDKKKSHDEKKKSSHDDDKKKTSHDDDQKKTFHDDDKKKTSHDDKKKTSHDDKKKTSHDDKKKTSHEDKKKTSHDDKKKTSHDDKKKTSHDDKKKTSHDDKKKSSHDDKKKFHDDEKNKHKASHVNSRLSKTASHRSFSHEDSPKDGWRYSGHKSGRGGYWSHR